MIRAHQSTSTSPWDQEIIGYSRLDSPEEVRAAVTAAREAQSHWAARPLRERVDHILRIRNYLVANVDELAAIIARDNGKTRVDAIATELLPAAMAATYYAANAKAFLADTRIWPSNPLLCNKISTLTHMPYGVVGIISPWNYPFSIPFSEVIMALLAGNAVLLKVATETQQVGRALERCLRAAGLPDHLFTYVNLPGRSAGDTLIEANVDKLFFTGSVQVGATLMAQASPKLIPLCLELGGNDPMLVCDDADLDRAAAGAAWGAFQNAGQTCAGIERIYVHTQVYDTFLLRLERRVAALAVGPDLHHNVDVGAMTTAKQRDLVQAHLDDALAQGARIHAQATAPQDGLFFPPTVLVDVHHAMRVMREETFGPLVAVMRVDTMDEAIALANDSDLGLTASVWSRNRRTAAAIARQLCVGVVTINDHVVSHGLAETPWGGVKRSGIGRTHGAIGFAEMTQVRCLVHDILPGVKKNMWWYPHDASIYQGLRGAMHLLYGSTWRARARGLRDLIRIFPRTFVT